MKTVVFAVLEILVAFANTRAQTGKIICGNDIFSSIVERQHPELAKAMATTFANALASPSFRQDEELTVQVYVHVVWKNPDENLHDSIIASQLEVLNEDFNRLNADTSQLRPFFAAEAGTSNIRFELAGIQRVQTSVDFEIDLLGTNLLAEVKHSDQGGSDAIDPAHFLNIWICHIQPIEIFGIEIGQILGFAFPPNNLPNWPADVGAPSPDEDGVVIDYRVFGRHNPNPLQIPGGNGNLVVKGRTAVHEVGHYLGLRHIWGDGGLLGPNDCAQSDGIDDTPYANAQSNFDCDITKNSCPGIETHYGTDAPDLIENYMDYASEECMTMFTNGQCELMRNVLLGPRSGLIMPFSSLVNPDPEITLTLYPNPARDEITVSFTWPDAVKGRWSVYSIAGLPVLMSGPLSMEAGPQRIPIDISLLSSGLYMLQWQSTHGCFTQRFVVANLRDP